jgi:hypothetical protein
MFATVFITVKSVQAEIADKGFTLSDLFTNSLFLTLIVSTASTYNPVLCRQLPLLGSMAYVHLLLAVPSPDPNLHQHP